MPFTFTLSPLLVVALEYLILEAANAPYCFSLPCLNNNLLSKIGMIVYKITNLHTITIIVIMTTSMRITMNVTPTPAPIAADKLPGYV